jgi:predicted RecB family endonuclease
MKPKKLTQQQAENQIRNLADKTGLKVLVIGDYNFSEGMTGKKFSKAEKNRLKDIFFELLCEDWNEKKIEAIDFLNKYHKQK